MISSAVYRFFGMVQISSRGFLPLLIWTSYFRLGHVFRVGAAYAIVAWLLVEVASVILPTFKTPEWVMQAFTFLLILGFPLTLVIAWAFELTPEGIKRESAVASDELVTQVTGRKLDFAIIGLLVIAVVEDRQFKLGFRQGLITRYSVQLPARPETGFAGSRGPGTRHRPSRHHRSSTG